MVHKMDGTSTRAFTGAFALVELLVVLAIIATLSAILFPVLGQAREAARSTECMSNMQQVGMSVLMYADDFDERFPMMIYYTDPGKWKNWYPWENAIAPYVRSGVKQRNSAGVGIYKGVGGVFNCPSFPNQNEYAQYGAHPDIFVTGESAAELDPSHWSTVATSELMNATPTVMLVEKGDTGSTWNYVNFVANEWDWTDRLDGGHTAGYKAYNPLKFDCDYPPHTSVPFIGCATFPRYRHHNTSNMVFCDGHARSVPKGHLDWATNIYPGRLNTWPTNQPWYPY